jgi:succinate dehydrogenase / fumarate reductase membrane anchor subunit
MRTPLSQVRGLGSAREGVGHFIQQRGSAIALIFLVPWFLFSLICATRGATVADRFANAEAWVSQPLNAVLIILTVFATVHHMKLGLQIVIEDYIGKHTTRIVLLLLNTFFSYALIAATLFFVLKIAS